jgi:hemerythrin-like domain-containing protein
LFAAGIRPLPKFVGSRGGEHVISASKVEPEKARPGRALVPDFSQPLDALKGCHNRTRAQCDMLRELAKHLPSHGCDAWAQQAASNILRYFDGAGRHHEEDEEHDLFPRMIAAAAGQAAERIALLTARLEREHREMAEMWLALRDSLECVAYGENTPLGELEVNRFCALYAAHMTLEDADVIPLAAAVLDDDALAAIGQAMAARRALAVAGQ